MKGSEQVEGIGQAEVAAPLSFAQQRLWLIDRLLPTGSAYNNPHVFRLSGELDWVALRDALNEVVRRHEALRTRIGLQDGAPVQVIAPKLELPLDVEDLRGCLAGERELEARRRAQADGQAAFDLERGPLIRARLLRLGAAEHWLLLTLHHIVTDGWSTGVLWRELSALYGAYHRGEVSPLAELPVQYADYAAWQRQWLQGAVLEQQLSYWRQALDELPTLDLPTDRPRPAVASYEGGRVAFELPEALTRALKDLGRREGATLFMTLLAAFQVLLYRYSGQEDIAVGVPIAGRLRPELEGLIGFFVNTLVLRGDLSGAPSFRTYLAQVRSRALDAYAHQDLPFEKLVEELAPKRDLSRNPLFQALLVLQNTPPGARQLPGLEVQRLEGISSESAKFDLSMSLTETAGRLSGVLECASDLFDAATIERMLGHWRTLLEGIVADPQQRISHLPLLTPAERHQLLVEWNATAVDYPRNKCIHQLFEEQAARTPEAVAVVCADRQLTYAELNARANQLAHHLRNLGVGPEVLVGLCLERSLELIIGLLGILKAGGAYVPLDPSYPQERLAFMLQDTQAPVLLTQQGLLGQLPPYAGHIVCLDRDWSVVAAQPESNPPSLITPENLAYLIYTSGSTGRPKGVMMPHRPLCNQMWWQMPASAISGGGRTLQLAPAGFDVSVQEVFSTLCAGGTLVLIAEGVRRDPTELLATMAKASIARLFLTFTALQQLAETANARQDGSCDLREVITAGEQLRITPAIARWLDSLPDCRLCNQYGPTETHVVTSYSVLEGSPESWPALPPIGRPIANTVAYVLDPNRQPVPVGVAGELYLGGDGLARGYWKRPELTAERFVLDPFSGRPGARLYRTGDRARYLPDGNLEFLGRLDSQVKLRGFRIELGEIEVVLAQQPQVREAVVLLREDTPGDPRLVAYVVAQGEMLAIADLRAALRRQLPDYMIPAAFVPLPALPLTPTGKIDRKALPASKYGSSEVEYRPPRTPIEKAIANLWTEVLKRPRVGIDDNFFDLGGHSLLAVQLLSRINRTLNIGLPLRQLFEAPTVNGLALAALERLVLDADEEMVRDA